MLRLSSQNAEAMNDLGVVQLKGRHWRDAAVCFNNALKLRPNYGPALLNLAVTAAYQGNRQLTLQKYHEYLEASPHDAKWDAVNSAATQLDQELNPAPPRPSTAAQSRACRGESHHHQYPNPAPCHQPAETFAASGSGGNRACHRNDGPARSGKVA